MFYGLYRVDQHDYVDYKAVVYPKDQDHLCRNKQKQRLPKSQFVSDREAGRTAQDIRHRINDRVAKIIEGDRRLTVSIDDIARVFGDLPRPLDHHRDQ